MEEDALMPFLLTPSHCDGESPSPDPAAWQAPAALSALPSAQQAAASPTPTTTTTTMLARRCSLPLEFTERAAEENRLELSDLFCGDHEAARSRPTLSPHPGSERAHVRAVCAPEGCN